MCAASEERHAAGGGACVREAAPFEPAEFRGPAEGTQRLYFEILMDALRCMMGALGRLPAGVRPVRPEQTAARAWIAGEVPDGYGPPTVTFEDVCQVLRLPWRSLRDRLLSDDPKITFVYDRGHRLLWGGGVPAERIRVLVASGRTFKEAAALCGVPLSTVRFVAGSLRPGRIAARNAEMRDMWRGGASVDAIATAFRVSRSTVRRVVLR
jgi:hypothetical protein